MNELLMLAVVPGVIWLILIFFRVPGVILILSILVGKLFAEELSQNIYDIISRMISVTDIRHIQLFLLLLPVVLTVILTQSKTPKSRVLSNAVPLLFASVSLALFALPYAELSSKLGENGQEIVSSYQSYIVCATAGIALLFAWLPGLKSGKHKKDK
ncbi:MAG TPA: hypothetical protein VD947_03070 [Patescibacteria group bacterium]|nr:hypothetical protein [Patescibacteria group bacterium]